MNEQNRLRLPTAVRRALWILAALVVIGAGLFLGWYLVHYRGYDEYRLYVQQPAEKTEAAALKTQKDPENGVPGFALVTQNDNLALYLNEKTAEIALRDRKSGRVVYSNPQDAAEDPVARSGLNQGNLKSQFILNYLDTNSREGTPWSSYSKCVENGQVEYLQLENGFRAVYTLSNEKLMLVPRQMTADWFEVLSSAGKKQAAKSYVLDEESGLYVLKSQGVTARNRQQIDADARKAGFTMEDYAEMEALAEAEESETAESTSFVIALDYTLTPDGLTVTIPHGEIMEAGGGKVRSIQLLPFFGAAGTAEEGSIVVPDGSGALIRFNNGRNTAPQYNQSIYDLDLIDSDFTATQNTQTARLALFGICREDYSLLVSCGRGASLASVTADVAGRNNSYNYAYFTFGLRRTDTLMVAGEEAIVAEQDSYPVDCAVTYRILDGEYTGYNGLAKAVRESLLADGTLKLKAEADGDIPFYCDILSGVRETAHWMGVQYLRVMPMTTFGQAEEILDSLRQEQIGNLRVNLQGWMNGGYYHDPVSHVSVLNELGGEKGLKALRAAAENAGGKVYPDAAIQLVTEIAKGFLRSEEASRYYAKGYAAELGVINPVSLRRMATLGFTERGYMLLSPRFLPRYAAKLAEAADRLELDALSLRDLGNEVHADKRRTNVISREADLDLVKHAFEVIGAGGRELMVSGGNDYSFPYIRHVINAPVEATMFAIVDEQIPLWELILHGSADYCGSPLNLMQSENRRATLLHLIEYGASTHYTFTWKDAADMKYTGLNNNYATTFSAWKEEAAESYRFVNGALARVSGAEMLRHDRLGDTLARVTYSNGMVLYVNSGEKDAEADGYRIPAMDYLAVGGENE